MKAYKALIQRVLASENEALDRTGVGTRYIFGESVVFNLAERFPIVSLRKIDYRQGFGELAAFIHGATTKTDFTLHGCKYWNTTPGVNGDNDNLGPIYGYQWVSWRSLFGSHNQLADLVKSLKENPYSRRHILSTWNVGELSEMALPPCHVMAQFNVLNGKLSCIVYMRSVDVMLGLPFDVLVYAVLTHLLALDASLDVGELIFFFGNCHIYKNHIDLAEELVTREPQKICPTLSLAPIKSLFNFKATDAELNNYAPSPAIKFHLNL